MNLASGGGAPSQKSQSEPSRSPEESEEGQDDVTLMLRVKTGDVEAFEVLVVRHQHSVVGTAAKMLGCAAEAEDIGQQVFIRVWKSAARYEPSAKFTTWLMTITRNLVFNEMRRRRRANLLPLEADQDDAAPRQFADGEAPAPSKELLDAELNGAINAAIAGLPENQRVAIVLRRYEGMPYEEIAQVLRTSVPAVKSILFRARSELKERLKKYLG
ncbi:MAG: sigma-70 family RNA polymerase sigma factor [Terrimicrobiaceae bacterium]